MQHEIDVVGIGNALVDVISHTEDAFLEEHGCVKGTMALVDAEQAERLYAAMGPGVEMSGGSTSNTLAGVASLGGSAGFIGRVRDDQLGAVFAHDIRAAGVEFTVPAATSGPPTGRCLVLVTPDAERTLNTFLGASAELGPDDVDEALVARGRVTFLEGYLWDPPAAREALRKAAEVARSAGRRVAFTLSDPLLVARNRSDFRDFVDGGAVDVLFANEREILALYEVDSFDRAVAEVRGRCEITVITRHDKGSVVITDSDAHAVGIHPVDVVDTTGAGDLYAAGFLFGLTHGLDLPRCGDLGARCASEVISHVGARPEASLASLAAGAGLL